MIHSKELLEELNYILDDMRKHEQDLMISVFGKEGSGKSTFALNLAKTLDSTFSAERVAITIHDFAIIAPKTKAFQCVLWDEAHHFSKRGMYDTSVNRILLKYFQTIRGAKRIVILCYPAIFEMDRYVTKHRTRLFFETVKKGSHYIVKGWKKEQILAKLDTFRLYKSSSKAGRWAGIPRKPILIFEHDMVGIEQLNEEYAKKKQDALKEADMELKEELGYYSVRDLVRECQKYLKLSDFAIRYHLKRVCDENNIKIEKKNKNYRISDELFQTLVGLIISDCKSSHLIKKNNKGVDICLKN